MMADLQDIWGGKSRERKEGCPGESLTTTKNGKIYTDL